MKFEDLRFGMFIHYGLFSILERGEWVMNKEKIPPSEYAKLAAKFTAENFDAESICDLAIKSGMKYINFTTMHHDGFRLYDSQLSEYNSVKACGRDLTAEIISAAKKRGLKISLYHSLNNWYDQPDTVTALEDKNAYDKFIKNTFARLEELVTKYNPVDILWYDGWWPFNSNGWKANEMNEMVRKIQPNIIFNGRNGLPGDFGTPEQHISAPEPWRPWEACITLNNNWGYHAGDHNWKSPQDVINMLAKVAISKGNLLLNIGPRSDGSIPESTLDILTEVGRWLKKNGEAIYDTDIFTFNLNEKGAHCSDWCHHGDFTVSGNDLYLIAKNWPGKQLVLTGLECKVKDVSILGINQGFPFNQSGGKITISDLPANSPDPICSVIKLGCNSAPFMYNCGGMRTPKVNHAHYDPCESDIIH